MLGFSFFLDFIVKIIVGFFREEMGRVAVFG